MTVLRFPMPYRLPGKAPRYAIARVVIDVPVLEGAVRAATQEALYRKKMHYMLHGGSLWAPAKANEHRLPIYAADYNLHDGAGKTEGLLQRVWNEPHPFVVSTYRFRQLMDGKVSRDAVPDGADLVLLDTDEMSETFLASEMWLHVRTVAESLYVVDGVFHARTIGPTIGFSQNFALDGQELQWFTKDGDIRSRAYPDGFCFNEQDLAIEYARSIGNDARVPINLLPKTYGIDLPTIDTVDHATETQAFRMASGLNYRRLGETTIGTLSAIVELRKMLQERYPDREFDFRDEPLAEYLKGIFDPVADTEELMEPLRVLGHIGALDMRRAARQRNLSADTDALATAFR